MNVSCTPVNNKNNNNKDETDKSVYTENSFEESYTESNTICNPNETYEQIDCTSQIANSRIAIMDKNCNETGSDFVYGDCLVLACQDAHYPSNNICKRSSNVCNGSNILYCLVQNGYGAKTRICNNGNWSQYTACTTIGCNAGYKLKSNICIQKLSPTPVPTPITTPVPTPKLIVDCSYSDYYHHRVDLNNLVEPKTHYADRKTFEKLCNPSIIPGANEPCTEEEYKAQRSDLKDVDPKAHYKKRRTYEKLCNPSAPATVSDIPGQNEPCTNEQYRAQRDDLKNLVEPKTHYADRKTKEKLCNPNK